MVSAAPGSGTRVPELPSETLEGFHARHDPAAEPERLELPGLQARLESLAKGKHTVEDLIEQWRDIGEALKHYREASAPAFAVARSPEELPREDPPAVAVEGPLCYSESFVLLGGDPKSLKTTLAVDVALAVCSGASVLGELEAHVSGPVVFLQADMGQNHFSFLVRQLARGHGLERFEHPLHWACRTDVNLADAATRHSLSAEIADLSPALVVVDPLRDVFQGSENDSQELRPVLDFFVEFRDRTSAVVLVVDHLTKPAGRGSGPAGYALRGAGSKYGRADSVLTVRDKNGTPEVTGVHRYGSPLEPLSFRLVDERRGGRGVPARKGRGTQRRAAEPGGGGPRVP